MKLQINIDGKQYEADIEVLEEERQEAFGTSVRPAPRISTPPVAPTTAVKPKAHVSTASHDKVCKSAIGGIVFKVIVTVGQTVNVGETLIVLEAMKMESNVVSHVAGKVKAILVAPGDSVKKGQVLLEFE